MNVSFHSLFGAAVGGAAAREGVTVDEEEEGVGTGGMSDLLREGMAAGSLGTACAIKGGGGWRKKI